MQEEKCGREFLGYWDIGTERMFRSPTGLKFEKLGVKVSVFRLFIKLTTALSIVFQLLFGCLMFVSTSKLVELKFQLDSKRFDLANFDRWFRFFFPTESSEFWRRDSKFLPLPITGKIKESNPLGGIQVSSGNSWTFS